jgi:hypothetical protein
MPDKPISPLRQRMIEDMTARRFKEKVQKDYVRHVRTGFGGGTWLAQKRAIGRSAFSWARPARAATWLAVSYGSADVLTW